MKGELDLKQIGSFLPLFIVHMVQSPLVLYLYESFSSVNLLFIYSYYYTKKPAYSASFRVFTINLHVRKIALKKRSIKIDSHTHAIPQPKI